MKITHAIASTYMRFSRWTFVHEEIPQKAVVIGAPHTSNWDGFLMAMAFWKVGRPFKFLMKDNFLKVPVLGRLFVAIGGIATNRREHTGLVGSMVHAAETQDTFTLIIAPEGTRSKKDYWKSGFYRIALETGLPVQLGFIDRRNKTYGWRGHMWLTGDVEADMDRLRAFYDGMQGYHPGNGTVARLRAEDDPAAREWLLEGIDL
ncbi:1-acyl-sn-glycerol-3-phosphate acyltransferase [Ancrocorticia populi]|uniref:1-acyl-sn-glycerol-3-phosphate acyltransferase n=1 Tax=Ancrocorticia populi TaxID=2175228 RepID=UPI003F9022C0